MEPERELTDDIEAVAASHAALVQHLRELDPVDPTAPSSLPDWTVGHVLTHIARNADGIVSVMGGGPQYEGGFEGRQAGIDAGASRKWDELVDDVGRTCAGVDAAFAACDDWTGTAAMLAGERPLTMVPFLRLREIEVHRADLGLGYSFADMPGRYVRKELRMMEMLWRARKPMGMTTLPDQVLALPPPTRLAWLMGRAEIEGLSPAGVF